MYRRTGEGLKYNLSFGKQLAEKGNEHNKRRSYRWFLRAQTVPMSSPPYNTGGRKRSLSRSRSPLSPEPRRRREGGRRRGSISSGSRSRSRSLSSVSSRGRGRVRRRSFSRSFSRSMSKSLSDDSRGRSPGGRGGGRRRGGGRTRYSRSRSPPPYRRRSLTPPPPAPLSKIYIAKLSRNVTKRHVEEIFSNYGTVIATDMPINRKNGLHKCYAYVEFEERKQAEQAIEYMNGAQIDGQVVTVEYIRPARQRRSPDRGRGRGGRNGDRSFNRRYGGGGGGYNRGGGRMYRGGGGRSGREYGGRRSWSRSPPPRGRRSRSRTPPRYARRRDSFSRSPPRSRHSPLRSPKRRRYDRSLSRTRSP
eukprot:Nk52_evm9s305 gene=Nk52_evmTU9s305